MIDSCTISVRSDNRKFLDPRLNLTCFNSSLIKLLYSRLFYIILCFHYACTYSLNHLCSMSYRVNSSLMLLCEGVALSTVIWIGCWIY
jgi:hypothetical protein